MEDLEKKYSQYSWCTTIELLLLKKYSKSDIDKYNELKNKISYKFSLKPHIINGISYEDLKEFKSGINNNIIDNFLKNSNLKIIPKENDPLFGVDLSEKSSKDDFELVTESLAEIYLKQGLKDKACKIYEQLSLKNPEKSIYFAELIEKMKK